MTKSGEPIGDVSDEKKGNGTIDSEEGEEGLAKIIAELSFTFSEVNVVAWDSNPELAALYAEIRRVILLSDTEG